ncbi:unnamed protein product [Prorocentrum cordatum]|uniref:Uncharacterized protein n=1 Tax=Prorocentrum cordatum TaxID=2364126 RepID=A0ABN9TW07_9DINO|nr:unnamed protein product [Polarella glacialis]
MKAGPSRRPECSHWPARCTATTARCSTTWRPAWPSWLPSRGLPPTTSCARRALAAGLLALALGHAAAADLVAAVRSELLPGACEGTAAGRRDVAALLAGPPQPREHLEMANAACSSRSALAVRPTAREAQAEAWTAQHMLQIWVLMRVCGVVLLEEVIPQDLVASVRQAQADHFALSPSTACARVPGAGRCVARRATPGGEAAPDATIHGPQTVRWTAAA